MVNLRGAIAMGALALSLIGGAATAAEMLTSDQVRALVSGNTVQGAMQSTGAYVEFYQPDGTIKGKDYTGAWSIDGDKMCFQYGSDPKSCWEVGREGAVIQWMKEGKVDGIGTVVNGNPYNF